MPPSPSLRAGSPWGPPVSALPSRPDTGYWNTVGLILADRPDLGSAVTSSRTARLWAVAAEARLREWDEIGDREMFPRYGRIAVPAAALVSTGVAVQDLYAVSVLVTASPSEAYPDVAAWGLVECAKQSAFADMPVRDMVGWLIAGQHLGDRDEHRVLERYQAWAAHDLGAGAWVFAAAGLSPAEAASGVRAGTLDEDAALTLAALTGVPLPVG